MYREYLNKQPYYYYTGSIRRSNNFTLIVQCSFNRASRTINQIADSALSFGLILHILYYLVYRLKPQKLAAHHINFIKICTMLHLVHMTPYDSANKADNYYIV